MDLLFYGHIVQRTYCSANILFSGHIYVQRTYCSMDLLFNGHIVQRTYCSTNILLSGHICSTDIVQRTLFNGQLFNGHTVQRTNCSTNILFQRHAVQRTHCSTDIQFNGQTVQRTNCSPYKQFTRNYCTVQWAVFSQSSCTVNAFRFAMMFPTSHRLTGIYWNISCKNNPARDLWDTPLKI